MVDALNSNYGFVNRPIKGNVINKSDKDFVDRIIGEYEKSTSLTSEKGLEGTDLAKAKLHNIAVIAESNDPVLFLDYIKRYQSGNAMMDSIMELTGQEDGINKSDKDFVDKIIDQYEKSTSLTPEKGLKGKDLVKARVHNVVVVAESNDPIKLLDYVKNYQSDNLITESVMVLTGQKEKSFVDDYEIELCKNGDYLVSDMRGGNASEQMTPEEYRHWLDINA